MESLKTYLKEVRTIPLLSVEEEIDLSKKIKKGNERARKKMIRANLRLVINIAKRYMHLGIPLMDLIEEGNIGLMKAVKKFDHERGYRFSTYAAWWIRQSISRSVSEQGRLVRIPAYMNESILKWKKASEQLSQKLKRIPTDKELAKKLKMSLDKIAQVKNLITTKISSLEAPIGEEGEDDIKDLIEDKTAVSPDKGIKELLDKERLNSLLGKMQKREREVLDLRFGLSDGRIYTLAEIAKRLKLSRERVRQIEEAALKQLRLFSEKQEKEL